MMGGPTGNPPPRREEVLLTIAEALTFAAEGLEGRALACQLRTSIDSVDAKLGGLITSSMPPELAGQFRSLREPQLQVEPQLEAARRIRALADEERIIEARRTYAARDRGGIS